MEKLTVDILVSLSGILVSLLAFYIPAFRSWVDGMGEYKYAFMAGVLLLITAVYTVIYCAGAWDCIKLNASSALLVWIAALGANQAAYQTIVKPAKERETERAWASLKA